MDKKVKWGIIGSGGIASRRTIPEGFAKSEHAELISLFDINKSVNDSLASQYNAVASDSVQELLDTEIDAVYVASPVFLHQQHVIDCANAKKHILCEKPFGLSVQEAEQMTAACTENQVSLGIGFMMKYHSQHQEAMHLIKKGSIGTPVYARAQLSCWYPPIPDSWRQDPKQGGGGSLVDMGSHCIDLLEMLFGKVVRLQCFINSHIHNYISEDSAIVSLKFENGALGTVDTFFCIPDNSSQNRLELYGSKGSILAKGTLGQGESGEMMGYFENNGNGNYNAQQTRDDLGGISIFPEPKNMYLSEVEEFSLSILNGKSFQNDYKTGLRNQRIVEACYESARSGIAVEI